MTLTVAIADDDPHLRDSLQLLVDDDPGMTVVGTAADGAQAIELVRRERPDVALLDIRMPRCTGIDAARVLAAEGSPTRIVVLTVFDLDEHVHDALRAGASGFLLKNSPPSEVLRAVRVAAAGDALLAPEVTRRLIATHVVPNPGDDARVARLTQRERETLVLIGRGASNDAIARELVVTPTTVRTYVSRILTKAGARDRAQLVVLAYESGLVTRGLSTPAD